MVGNLNPQDIPEAVKTVRVNVFDENGVRTGAKDERATYFWQTPDGGRHVGQASVQEKGMFEIDIDADNPSPTIQVNKYSIEGVFLGGPWRIRDMA